MNVKSVIRSLFEQLSLAIGELSDEEYSKPSVSLSGSSIGQHVRHTLEFFDCLLAGLDEGLINYDRRERDTTLETSTSSAMRIIDRLDAIIHNIDKNSSLILELSYGHPENDAVQVSSNLDRELVYNIEHTIHHMALIKIGIREIKPELVLPKGFGVASSTIQYQKEQAQNS